MGGDEGAVPWRTIGPVHLVHTAREVDIPHTARHDAGRCQSARIVMGRVPLDSYGPGLHDGEGLEGNGGVVHLVHLAQRTVGQASNRLVKIAMKFPCHGPCIAVPSPVPVRFQSASSPVPTPSAWHYLDHMLSSRIDADDSRNDSAGLINKRILPPPIIVLSLS
jgi:hypothetical protein